MTEDIRDAGPGPAGEPGTPEGGGKAASGSRPPGPEPAGGALPVGGEPELDEFATGTIQAEQLEPAAEPDYKDRWLRAEAEIQNTRRRSARDREDAVRASEERILLDMVEVLDDLERALAALPGEHARAAWGQGVALTAQRLRDALARRGVSPIATLGEPFDPAFHEALLEVPAPEGIRPGAVAKEVQKGYRRGDRALRAARVVVARADG